MDRCADYEDQIQQLKAQHEQLEKAEAARRASTPTPSEAEDPNLSPPRFLPVTQNRFSSFLTARKSTPNLKSAPQTPTTPSTDELVAALSREQTLRQAADRKLDAASDELEELSAQLFTQANEMVATERRARAKLEQRVELLERRDGEKKKRLERLEGAMQRIERVRALLAPGR